MNAIRAFSLRPAGPSLSDRYVVELADASDARERASIAQERRAESAAITLDTWQKQANRHVMLCTCWIGMNHPCRVLRALRRQIEHAERHYRRELRRLRGGH